MNQNQRQHQSLPSEGYVRQSFLLQSILPFSAATLWRKVGKKAFPNPVKLSSRVSAWRVEDVRAWMTFVNSGQEESPKYVEVTSSKYEEGSK